MTDESTVAGGNALPVEDLEAPAQSVTGFKSRQSTTAEEKVFYASEPLVLTSGGGKTKLYTLNNIVLHLTLRGSPGSIECIMILSYRGTTNGYRTKDAQRVVVVNTQTASQRPLDQMVVTCTPEVAALHEMKTIIGQGAYEWFYQLHEKNIYLNIEFGYWNKC